MKDVLTGSPVMRLHFLLKLITSCCETLIHSISLSVSYWLLVQPTKANLTVSQTTVWDLLAFAKYGLLYVFTGPTQHSWDSVNCFWLNFFSCDVCRSSLTALTKQTFLCILFIHLLSNNAEYISGRHLVQCKSQRAQLSQLWKRNVKTINTVVYIV